VQYGTKQSEQCATLGAFYITGRLCGVSKKSNRPFKRKYKADLKRRWRHEVELELIEREKEVPQDAQ